MYGIYATRFIKYTSSWGTVRGSHNIEMNEAYNHLYSLFMLVQFFSSSIFRSASRTLSHSSVLALSQEHPSMLIALVVLVFFLCLASHRCQAYEIS